MSSHATSVAIFNDTSCGQHFGCDAVMETICTLVGEHGGIIRYRHPVGQPWRDHAPALAALDQVDLVLVNGEGTIHHSSEKARALAALGPYCAARQVPCYLINATLQANDASIMSDIAAFSSVWVRETASQTELARFGTESTVCGDLSLFHHHAASEDPQGRPLVLDSVNRRLNIWLGELARGLGADFVSMKIGVDGALAYPPRTRFARLLRRKPRSTVNVPGVTNFRDFAQYMANHSYLVTGRFHGFCFGLVMQLPMSVLPSNTWKCEAVLCDVGLNARRLIEPGGEVPLLPLTEQERTRMRDYVAKSRDDIRALFGGLLHG